MQTPAIEPTMPKTDNPNFSLRSWHGRFIKRAFDIAASALGLLILSPVFGFLIILIKREDPGPVFYRGPRLGRGDKPFNILKFRTMREEAASYDGPRLTAEDDARVTPLGKWLRDTKLNELPQLWNVLKGEMSLVGPRPEDPEIAQTWPLDVRAEVLSMRPGITSPASVLFRDEEKMLSASRLMDTYLGEIQPSKLRLDQLYVRRHSFLLDLDVLFWTFLVVLVPKLRDHKPPEDTLFWGPISRFGRRYFNWFFMDAFTTFFAFGLVSSYWRFFVAPLDLGLFAAFVIATAFSILASSIAGLTGVQKISWSSASAADALELIPPIALAFLAAVLMNTWMPLLPYHVIQDTTILAFIGYVVTRYRSRLVTGLFTRWVAFRRNNLIARERVLIIGAGDAGQFAAWRLTHSQADFGYEVAGFVDDDMYRQGMRLKGISILGRRKDISELVKKHDIGVIVFAIHNISVLKRQDILDTCRKTGARVITWPDMVSLIRPQPVGNHSPAPELEFSLPPGKDALECEQVLRWLDALETDLTQGDYAVVVQQIHAMRKALQAKQKQ